MEKESRRMKNNNAELSRFIQIQIYSVGIYQKLETGTMSFTTLDLPAPAEDLEVYSFASTLTEHNGDRAKAAARGDEVAPGR